VEIAAPTYRGCRGMGSTDRGRTLSAGESGPGFITDTISNKLFLKPF
jgi:hypothetical protein